MLEYKEYTTSFAISVKQKKSIKNWGRHENTYFYCSLLTVYKLVNTLFCFKKQGA